MSCTYKNDFNIFCLSILFLFFIFMLNLPDQNEVRFFATDLFVDKD